MSNYVELTEAGDTHRSSTAIEPNMRLASVRHRLGTLVDWRLNGPLSPAEEATYWSLCNDECELLNCTHARTPDRIERSVNFAARTSLSSISLARVPSSSTTESLGVVEQLSCGVDKVSRAAPPRRASVTVAV